MGTGGRASSIWSAHRSGCRKWSPCSASISVATRKWVEKVKISIATTHRWDEQHLYSNIRVVFLVQSRRVCASCSISGRGDLLPNIASCHLYEALLLCQDLAGTGGQDSEKVSGVLHATCRDFRRYVPCAMLMIMRGQRRPRGVDHPAALTECNILIRWTWDSAVPTL